MAGELFVLKVGDTLDHNIYPSTTAWMSSRYGTGAAAVNGYGADYMVRLGVPLLMDMVLTTWFGSQSSIFYSRHRILLTPNLSP